MAGAFIVQSPSAFNVGSSKIICSLWTQKRLWYCKLRRWIHRKKQLKLMVTTLWFTFTEECRQICTSLMAAGVAGTYRQILIRLKYNSISVTKKKPPEVFELYINIYYIFSGSDSPNKFFWISERTLAVKFYNVCHTSVYCTSM